MKKSDVRGFSKVFGFTLTQTLRAKSFVITMIIMAVFALGASPVMSALNKDKDKESPVEKVYVAGENISGIPFEDSVKNEENYSHIAFSKQDGLDTEELEKKLAEDKEKAVILKYEISEEGMYMLHAYYTAESKLDESDVSDVTELIKNWYSEYKVSSLNIDDETLKQISKDIKVKELEVEEFLKTDKPEIISQSEYMIVYALLFVAYMIIIMSANMVGTKVVEEKTNRIVEYLMTTVRPLALVLGKIVAMLLVTVGELLLLLVAALSGKAIAKAIFGNKSVDALSKIVNADLLKTMSVGNILLGILIIGLGILIYALIAGLFSATVSKMEELQQGMKNFNIIMIASFIAAVVSSNMMWTVGINGFVKFTLYFPFTSVFVLPGSILIGKASAMMIIISLILMAATACAVLFFVSLVYETIIVSNGAPISLKQMINIAKGSKKSAKEVK